VCEFTKVEPILRTKRGKLSLLTQDTTKGKKLRETKSVQSAFFGQAATRLDEFFSGTQSELLIALFLSHGDEPSEYRKGITNREYRNPGRIDYLDTEWFGDTYSRMH
jgi:hypothetical protein